MKRNRTHTFQHENKDYQNNNLIDPENEDREGVFAYDKYGRIDFVGMTFRSEKDLGSF